MLTPNQASIVQNSYKWIKVPAFHVSRYQGNWEKAISALRSHHEEECLFLIEFLKEHFSKSIPLTWIQDLPSVKQHNQDEYYRLDTIHLRITQALIHEIRQSIQVQVS